MDNGFVVGYFSIASIIRNFGYCIFGILLVPGSSVYRLHSFVGSLSRSCILIGMVHSKFPAVSIGTGLNACYPAAANLNVGIGMICFIFILNSHVRLECRNSSLTLDRANLSIISLSNIADNVIGKISAFFKGRLIERISDAWSFRISGGCIDCGTFCLPSNSSGQSSGKERTLYCSTSGRGRMGIAMASTAMPSKGTCKPPSSN